MVFMDNKINIQDLLEKFKAGVLSPEELAQLYSIIKQGDSDKSLKETMSELWSQAGMPADIPTHGMWHKINSLVDAENKRVPVEKLLGWKRILKYAAVIGITALLTWFARSLFESPVRDTVSDTSEVNYNEVSVSFGSRSRIVLPDGSLVILNSGSKLRYPAQFSRTSRNVYLEGEGFFEVEKKTSQPFFVKTKKITVRVLGTKFNVKSYDDEKTIETTVVSGKVEIFANKDFNHGGAKKIVLEPNQQALFYKDSEELGINKGQSIAAERERINEYPLEIKTKVDIVEVTSWKDNRLVFRNERFVELATRLERWYDVKIDIKDDELKTILFTGTFQKESIEQALNALKLIIPFQYEMKMNQITIKKLTKTGSL